MRKGFTAEPSVTSFSAVTVKEASPTNRVSGSGVVLPCCDILRRNPHRIVSRRDGGGLDETRAALDVIGASLNRPAGYHTQVAATELDEIAGDIGHGIAGSIGEGHARAFVGTTASSTLTTLPPALSDTLPPPESADALEEITEVDPPGGGSEFIGVEPCPYQRHPSRMLRRGDKASWSGTASWYRGPTARSNYLVRCTMSCCVLTRTLPAVLRVLRRVLQGWRDVDAVDLGLELGIAVSRR